MKVRYDMEVEFDDETGDVVIGEEDDAIRIEQCGNYVFVPKAEAGAFCGLLASYVSNGGKPVEAA